VSETNIEIAEAFERLFRSRPGHQARKRWNICCPMCGDRRQRCGFIRTSTGGFTVSCFNGGCSLHDHGLQWEAGSGLHGRHAELFRKLGGDARSLPQEEVRKVYKKNAADRSREVRNNFPDIALPPGSIKLEEAIATDPRSQPVAEWLLARSEVYFYPEYLRYFYWSRLHPHKLRIAFIHYDRIVGYLDRDTTKMDGFGRFMQRCGSDYLFGQHTVSSLPGPYVYVVESPMDAMLLHGVATRSSKPTQLQINFLLQSGKTPIWIPDLKDNEWEKFIEVAEQNKHFISVPEWKFKDPGESFPTNGVLGTAHLILQAKTNNYRTMRMKIKQQLRR
jgi:hypothetical protein